MESHVIDVQLALFISDTYSPRGYSDIVHNLRQHCRILDGANETILPVPLDAPDDIPRVIIKTTDGRYEITILRRKISFIIKNNAPSSQALPELLSDLASQSVDIRSFLTNQSWEVNRVGVITNISYECGNGVDARTWLTEHYLAENVYGMDDPLEVYVRLASQHQLNEKQSNYVIQIGHGQPDGGHTSTIMTNFDINTTPHPENPSFSLPDVELGTYINAAIASIQDLPGQYHLEE